MATFDSWEVGICPDDDYLMHWGIPGMKHGRRRYQNEDGTWTSVGLAERRKREGFGEGKKIAKARKKIERAERHQARKAARMEARQIRADKKRQKSLKGLTDEELQKKIARIKMEQEYKELTRSPLLKSGEHLFNSIMNYKENKEQRVIDLNKQKIDLERIKADKIRAIEGSKRAKQEAKSAKQNRKKAKEERKKAYITKDTDYLNAKKEYKALRSNTTIFGGIRKRLNKQLSSGVDKEYEAVRKARGEAEGNRIKSAASKDLNNKQREWARADKIRWQKQQERDLRPQKRREEKLRKERAAARKQFEKRMKRITSF